MDLLKPSYASGYAKNASQSAHPNLWDGLVGAWMPSLGVTGETLRDVSGNGNHGTLTGMDAATDWVTSEKGLALDFGGSPNYVNFSSIDLKLNPDAISFVFWFKGSDPRSVLRIQSLNQNSPYIVPIWGAGYTFIQSNNGLAGPSSPAALRDGNWHHCAAVYDRNKFYGYYLDGKVSNNTTSGYSQPLPTNFTSTQMFRLWKNSEYSVGKFASGSIYNRALSPQEIKHLYVDSLAPFRTKKRTVVRVPAAIPAATVVGSIKKPTTIIKPSYQAGYARNASESENPKLWDGLVGAWMPSMGDCGYDLNDLSGRGNHAELDGRSSPAPLKVIDGSRQIVLDGSSDYFRVNNVKDFSPKELTYCYWVTQPLLAGTYAPGGVWRTGKRSWLSQHGAGYPQFYHSNNGSTSSVLASSVSLINNKLTFVAMRYGKGSKSIWQNGVRTALATGAGVSGDLFDSQTEFCIGDFLFNNSSTPFGRSWQGGISAQMVYSRVLSVSEIKQLYVDSLAPFRKKQRVSVAVPAAVAPSATYHPLRSLAHPLEQ